MGREDPLGKGMVTHFSFLAWEIRWAEKLGGIQSMESQRVRHDSAYVCAHTHTHTHTQIYQTGVPSGLYLSLPSALYPFPPAPCPGQGKLTYRGCIKRSLSLWFCLDSVHGEPQHESAQRKDDEVRGQFISLVPSLCGVASGCLCLLIKVISLLQVFPLQHSLLPDSSRSSQPWSP